MTSDAGLLLPGELDECLGLSTLIECPAHSVGQVPGFAE